MLRPNVGSGLKMMSFVQVIGKSRDDVSRERWRPTHSPLLDISIVVPTQVEGEWGCTEFSLAEQRPAPSTAVQGTVSADDSFNAPGGKGGYTGGLY